MAVATIPGQYCGPIERAHKIPFSTRYASLQLIFHFFGQKETSNHHLPVLVASTVSHPAQLSKKPKKRTARAHCKGRKQPYNYGGCNETKISAGLTPSIWPHSMGKTPVISIRNLQQPVKNRNVPMIRMYWRLGFATIMMVILVVGWAEKEKLPDQEQLAHLIWKESLIFIHMAEAEKTITSRWSPGFRLRQLIGILGISLTTVDDVFNYISLKAGKLNFPSVDYYNNGSAGYVFCRRTVCAGLFPACI